MNPVPSDQTPSNKGVVTYGGTTNLDQTAVGDHATVNITSPAPQPAHSTKERQHTYDVGVVTILAVETHAVTTVLGLEQDTAGPGGSAGPPCYIGTVPTTGDGTVSVVATRTLSQGHRSVPAALAHLRRRYDPAVLVLAGIGGGIHPDLALGDVVLATRVVYYDLRKDTPRGVRRRGDEHPAPAWVGHAVNAFFTDHGEPASLRREHATDPADGFRVFAGPIGSGEAVVADAQSEIRSFLSAYNDKILAVDMEAGGLSQFCHELSATAEPTPGWVVIRGISDHADLAKDDDYHRAAALHAAHTVRSLLPYISKRPPT